MKKAPSRHGESDSGQHVLVIRNRQRARAIDAPLLRRIIKHVVEADFLVAHYELCFHLVDADEMARINEQYLQHSGSTDVITFDYSEAPGDTATLRGEIFISIPDAVAQAREFDTTWTSELVRYAIHGLLHLRGFDDLEPAARRVMKREENRLVKKVEHLFATREIARPRASVRR